MNTTPQFAAPLHAALFYATLGWSVIPLHTPTERGCSCNRRECGSPGKHPWTRHGVYDATNDLDAIERSWRRRPDANVGIATGNLIVLDVDGADGLSGLAELEHQHQPLPSTAIVRTGRGVHLYFLAPRVPIGNSAAALPDAIHVRGRGAYAVAPPSLHPTGVRYRWKCGGPPAPLPEWLADRLTSAPTVGKSVSMPPIITGSRYLQGAIEGELRRVATARKDTRNNTLNLAAFRLGQLVGAGLGRAADLQEPLLAAARAAGLGAAEARATIASGLRAGQLRPRRGHPPGS